MHQSHPPQANHLYHHGQNHSTGVALPLPPPPPPLQSLQILVGVLRPKAPVVGAIYFLLLLPPPIHGCQTLLPLLSIPMTGLPQRPQMLPAHIQWMRADLVGSQMLDVSFSLFGSFTSVSNLFYLFYLQFNVKFSSSLSAGSCSLEYLESSSKSHLIHVNVKDYCH
jgi:hypothetical protein